MLHSVANGTAAFSNPISTSALALPQRAWMFGPRRVGPNILLAVPPSASAAAAAAGAHEAASSSGGSGSLFDLPATAVVKLSKHHGRAPTPGGLRSGEAQDAGAPDEEQQEQQARCLGPCWVACYIWQPPCISWH